MIGEMLSGLWRRENIVKHLAAILFAAGLTVVLTVVPIDVRGLEAYGYLGIFLLALVSNATVILPAPYLVAVFAAGQYFNPLLLGLSAGLGAALGETTGYLAGYGGSVVAEKSETYSKAEAWMRRYGFFALLIMATIPSPLFDVVGMVAGALKYPYWKFLLAAAIGKCVKTMVLALGGHFLPHLFFIRR
jgi:membrane protein YqaA with SNARE-associated domain